MEQPTGNTPALSGGQDRRIVVRVPLDRPSGCAVQAGASVAHSSSGTTHAYLYGLPFFRDPWVSASGLAACWVEDRQRVLESIDGSFLLLVVTPGDVFLVNDKVSPLTWYWTHKDGCLHASNSLRGLLDAAGLPIQPDYHALRYYLYTRSHHFDYCVVKGVRKLLKGHLLGRDLKPQRYYWLPDRIRHGATPGDYFEHLREFIKQTMSGKKVATLASNGYDSRMNCAVLSQCLDHFDVITIKSDLYSEHHATRRFLACLPKQNYRLRVFGHSMDPGSPRYTPRRVHTHSDTFLSCFDDFTENKEHFLFCEIFDTLAKQGYDVLVTGCMGGDVRCVLPLAPVNHRASDLDQSGTPRTRELFGLSEEQVAQRYRTQGHHDLALEFERECLGDGQMNYTAPLLMNLGLAHVPLPVCTARAMEVYRGIDRCSLPGHGGVNFFREFLQEAVPDAAPIPFDTGIALHVPFEEDRWLAGVVDVDFAHRAMLDSGLFDREFLELMRDTYGRQRPPHYTGDYSYLNLWAWFAVVTNQPERFSQSLGLLAQGTPCLQPRNVRRGFQVLMQRLVYALRLLFYRIGGWRDHRHPINRVYRWSKTKIKRGVYLTGSTVYGVLRKCIGLPPWERLRPKR